MFCCNCGRSVADGDKFCSVCGTPVAAPAQPQPIPAEPAPVPQAPAAPPQAPAEPAPVPVPTFMPAPSVVPGTQPAGYTPPAPPAKPPKKKKGGLIVVAVILVLALIAAAVYFLLPHFTDKDTGKDTGRETGTATQPSEPSASTEATADPAPKAELTVVPAELVYEMTGEDVDTFYTLLEQCEEQALAGADADAVMEISDALDDQYTYMDGQYTIAMILYYCDLKDEDASQLYLDCTDIVTEAYNGYMEMAKRLYDADFAAKDAFFEEWTEQDLAMLNAYTPEVMALEQRNSEIEVAYQDMQDSATMYEDMVPLYVEMVQNNNRIAEIYGYDNYYTYAYDLVYTRDYGSEEVAQMRSFVSGYLVDAAGGAMDRFMASMEDLGMLDQLSLSSFLLENYETVYADEVAEYFDALPAQTREDMLDMFNGNILMMDDAKNAREGAFTANIGEDRAVCFFGPGQSYSSALTIMHEVGHYYGSKHTYLPEMPLDLAETQSQGNEWLFLAFMESKMGSKLYSAIVDYKTFNDLTTILICTIVDEFEERVYTHPDVASLTSDDLDAIMEEVCESYGGLDFLEGNIVDIQSYWRLVVIEQPVYYISYGVSAIAAMNLYTEATADFDNAVDIYRGLIEEVDLDSGFLGNLETAGLSGPFDEDFYRDLRDLYVN